MKILKKIIQLCLDICKNPTQGKGKPELLKFDLQGYWSRRIDKEHRIIYTFDSKSSHYHSMSISLSQIIKSPKTAIAPHHFPIAFKRYRLG